MVIISPKDGLYRIVDEFTGNIALKRNGKPWDNGGHANISTAMAQATNINSGIEMDTTSPRSLTIVSEKAGKDGLKGDKGDGIYFRGEWTRDAIYRQGDLVRFKGDVWHYSAANAGNGIPLKISGPWEVFIERGESVFAGGGAKGDKGDDGVGVPSGGLTGQALVKSSNTDFDTEWADVSGSAPIGVRGVVARLSSNLSNVVGDGLDYILSGLAVDEDTNLEYNSITGVFTSSSTSFKEIYCSFVLDNMIGRDASAKVVVSSTDYSGSYWFVSNYINPVGDGSFSKVRMIFSGLIPMNQSDTMTIVVNAGQAEEVKNSSILSQDFSLRIR